MPPASNIILQNISALKLAPNDVLVVHATKLSPEQAQKLQQELTRQLWGKPNTALILTGDYKVGTMAKNPTNLAAVMASQLESDPVMAALVKEHCPPAKLVRLLGLEAHIGEVLAEKATGDGPPIVATPPQPGELDLRNRETS